MISLYNILFILDKLFFIYCGLTIAYLFIFGFFSRFKSGRKFPTADTLNHIAVFIPAYKENQVLKNTVSHFLNQTYPQTHYTLVIIADHISPEILEEISSPRTRVLKVNFKNSTKIKSIQAAIKFLDKEHFDLITILDADNIVMPDYLHKINDAFDSGVMAVQAHRKAKNRNTDIAILDATSEEINNSIFRKAHVFLGLPAALSGSGMAFNYTWFKEHIFSIHSVGEDKELELLLLRENIFIDYLNDVPVFDEKTSQGKSFGNQRRRWIAAQINAAKTGLKKLPGAILSGNIAYIDKVLQFLMLPRILLMGFVFIISLFELIYDWELSVKWIINGILLILALAMSIPKELDNNQLNKAIWKIPYLFLLMIINLFKARSAKTEFIHTEHEIK